MDAVTSLPWIEIKKSIFSQVMTIFNSRYIDNMKFLCLREQFTPIFFGSTDCMISNQLAIAIHD